MKEESLDKLLKKYRQTEIQPPENLGSTTIRLLHSVSPPKGRRQRAKRICKGIGIVATACFMIMVGAFSTWAAMTWWIPPYSQPAGGAVDLSSHPRIIEVQEQAPFELALPAWLPQGYNLKNVTLDDSESPEDVAVFLQFEGPKGTEPVTLRQAYTFEQTTLEENNSMQFVKIDYGTPYWLDSDDTGWGTGTRNDIGYYWQGKTDDAVMEHTLIFTTDNPDNRSYITIQSGSPYYQSRVSDSITETAVILEIARSITGTDVSIIPEQEVKEEYTKNWAIVQPSYIPQDYTITKTQLTASLSNDRPTYSSTLTYSTDNDSIEIQQWQSQEPPQSQRGDKLELNTSQPPLPSYYEASPHSVPAYYSAGANQKITFTVDADCYYNFEVSTDSAGLGKEELAKIAQSLTGQYTRTPSPTKEQDKFYVHPTTFALSFGPDEDCFISYLPANNTVAKLFVEDSFYDLPGLILGEYGPVWWRGDKIVYHVQSRNLNPDEQSLSSFFVYDSSDHSHIEIKGVAEWTQILKPVFLDEETLAVLADDGIWQYDLSVKDWELTLPQEIELKEAYWSPDTSKVAYISQGEQDLIVLDPQTGTETVVYEADASSPEGILDVAWSSDSSKLAFVHTSSQGYVWENKELAGFDINAYTGNLGWAPGQDIISYKDQTGLALVRKSDGQWNHWSALSYSYFNYAWLPNGNLALIGNLVTNEQDEVAHEVCIYSWK